MRDEPTRQRPPLIDPWACAARPGLARVFWPPAAASALLLAIVAFLAHRVSVANGGWLTYVLDDIYIHMAIARSLAEHGVWGASSLDGFSSSSSSLLYPPLLAACERVFGAHESTPLVINLVASAAALFYAAWMLGRFSVVGWRGFLVLAGIVVLVPMPVMIATGMEHSLHILVTLVFVDVAVGLLAADLPAGTDSTAHRVGLPLLGGLLTVLRYEGLFLVGIVGLLLLLRRRWRLAALLGIAAGAPLVLFGWYATSRGWFALPNSILIKGNLRAAPGVMGVVLYLTAGLRKLASNSHLLIVTGWLAVMLWCEWRRERTLWAARVLLPVMTLGLIALQLQFADVGWFYRYEAYIMVLALLVLGLWLVREFSPDAAGSGGWTLARRGAIRVGAAVLLLVCGVRLGARSARALGRVPVGCHNIYEQQYQMGRFVRRFYNGAGIAANDVGAINYLADVRMLDTYGLVDIDVMRARRARRFDHSVVERLIARSHVRAVIVYDTWAHMYGGALPEWTPVGQWTLTDNNVCSSDTVTFYAPNDALVPELTRALQQFSPELPASVVQKGLYRGEHVQHVTGTSDPIPTGPKPSYRTDYSASFFLYPLEGPATPTKSPDAVLRLEVRPTAPAVGLDVMVNGATVQTQQLPDAGRWTTLSVPVKWREGMNVVRLIGHGTPGARGDDGNGTLMDIGEPGWTPAGANP